MNKNDNNDLMYQNLLSIFTEDETLTQNSLIKKEDLEAILNHKLMEVQQEQFKREILKDIWQQCTVNTTGTTTIREICLTIQEAITQLQNKIHLLNDQQNGCIIALQRDIESMQVQLTDTEEYFPYEKQRISTLRKSILQSNAVLSEYKYDLGVFRGELKMINALFKQKPLQKNTRLPLTSFSNVQPTDNRELLFCFHATNICLCLQLLVSAYRFGFLSQLAYLQVYFLLFFGYYGNHSAKYCLGTIALSLLFDFGFLFISLLSPLKIMPYRYSKIQWIYLIMLGLLVVTAIIRIVIWWWLLTFREVSRGLYALRVWGHRFILSPFSAGWKGQHQ